MGGIPLLLVSTYKKYLQEKKERRQQQHIFIYCPRCRNEMIKNGHFISDNYGIIKYECSKCGNVSFWDFVHFPVPYLRTCGDCGHVRYDDIGKSYCDKNCAPSNQYKFIYKIREM